MTHRPNARPHGQVRHSQVVTTFGPGSLVDLPNHSVVIGGLENWTGVSDEVREPRLVEKLKAFLLRQGVPVPQLKLFAPPPDNDDPVGPRTGITAFQFPEWFVTQDVEAGPRGTLTRSRMIVHRRGLTKGRFIDDRRKKHPVVPIRFVRACRRGHIGDIDWYWYAHRGVTECRRPLWIDERGTSGDLAEIVVRCECGKERRLSEATMPGKKLLGSCDGHPARTTRPAARSFSNSASNAGSPYRYHATAPPPHAGHRWAATTARNRPSVGSLDRLRRFGGCGGRPTLRPALLALCPLPPPTPPPKDTSEAPIPATGRFESQDCSFYGQENGNPVRVHAERSTWEPEARPYQRVPRIGHRNDVFRQLALLFCHRRA